MQLKILENQEPGYHEITWAGVDQNDHPLPSGIYFYEISIKDDLGHSFLDSKNTI